MPENQRLDALDALRGLAITWMTVFHFCFDLNHLGFWKQDFYRDPFWTWQRTAIVSLFLFCAGLGQAIAAAQGLDWPRFWRRWWQVAACALAVTVGSWCMFPVSFIYFGVLHGLAVMLLLARATTGWRSRWLWGVGGVALASPWLAAVAHQNWPAVLEVLNTRPLNWLGWISRKPVTEDYVPVFPWLGVMLWGMATGHWLLRKPWLQHRLVQEAWCRGRLVRGLAWLGRWSLSYYMLHQPMLLALLSGWLVLRRAWL